MTDDTPIPDISSQFRELGENLKTLLRATWEREETQQLRRDIQTGLDELSKAVNQTVDEVRRSEAGQKIKAEAEDIKASIERGEVEVKTREDISKALNFLNTELSKLGQKVAGETAERPENEPSGEESG